MSKQKIAPTRGEGIPTPQTLTETQESGNTQPFHVGTYAEVLDTAITDKAVGPMQTAVDAFGWIATLQAIIAETTKEGLAVPAARPNAERRALSRISDLAEIAKYIADDIGNHVDCEREDLRDDHLPRLLAALPNGGDA